MYVPNTTVVHSKNPSADFVQELAMPQAVLRENAYTCRTENDLANWNRSPRLFSNPTKQDRYGAQTFSSLPGGVLTFPHGSVEKVPLTEQALAGSKLVGSMKQFGANGAGAPRQIQIDPSGNPIQIDASGNRIGLGAIGLPGGPAPPGPARIRPVVDVRPDKTRPNRIAGVVERVYAPA